MRTITEIQNALIEGRLSVTALIERVLQEAASGAPEAWIALREKQALLDDAHRADQALAGEGAAILRRQPLFGIPFAVKDNIDVAGIPTTAACPGFATGPAQENAFVVARLIEAGAIPVGKTNLDQFATGLVGIERDPPLVGEPQSPINPDPECCRFASRCPKMQLLCQGKMPVLEHCGTGHRVACHFALEAKAVASKVLSVMAARQ